MHLKEWLENEFYWQYRKDNLQINASFRNHKIIYVIDKTLLHSKVT